MIKNGIIIDGVLYEYTHSTSHRYFSCEKCDIQKRCISRQDDDYILCDVYGFKSPDHCFKKVGKVTNLTTE